MGKNYLFLKFVLGSICIGHLFVGLLALISGQKALRLGSRIYGANFTPSGQFEYIIRPLGVYMLALAFLQGVALSNPQRYKVVIDATLVVFVLRQFQRLWYVRTIRTTFGIPTRAHLSGSLFYLVMATLLLIGRLTLEADSDQS